MHRLFRSRHWRSPKSKCGVHRLYAQQDAPLRIVAEALGRERSQLPSLGLALVSLSYGGLLFGHVPLDKGIDRQSHGNHKRGFHSCNDDSLHLSCGLAASQDVLRLQSSRLGVFFGTLGYPPFRLAQIFAVKQEAFVVFPPTPTLWPGLAGGYVR